ncbi:GntR family transcriptional regulator [Rhizobacter sp. P5_C2]
MLPWTASATADRLNDVRDTSLAKLVRDDVLELILHGALLPGQRINEPDIAARLKVSRVPVREALRELESSGLVVSRKNAGVFVRQLEAIDVRELYELREMQDGYAASRVAALPAARRQPLARRLEAAIGVMNASVDSGDAQAYYAENLKFHWAIVEAVGNRQLLDAYRGVIQRLHVARLTNLSGDAGRRISIAEHLQIAKALRQGDAAACEQLARAHVTDAHARLIPTQQTGDTR